MLLSQSLLRSLPLHQQVLLAAVLGSSSGVRVKSGRLHLQPVCTGRSLLQLSRGCTPAGRQQAESRQRTADVRRAAWQPALLTEAACRHAWQESGACVLLGSRLQPDITGRWQREAYAASLPCIARRTADVRRGAWRPALLTGAACRHAWQESGADLLHALAKRACVGCCAPCSCCDCGLPCATNSSQPQAA